MAITKTILDYIESTWVAEQIWYNLSSKGNEAKNISKFLAEQIAQEDLLMPIILGEGWNEIENEERKIYLIMKWVYENIKYRSDTQNYKATEYWASVKEILNLMSDDCEGGACLIIAFGRLCGIPKERIKLWCGYAENPLNPGEEVGHACAIYKSTKWPYVWFFMDWCYHVEFHVPCDSRTAYIFNDDLSIKRPVDSKYIKAWFVVDEEKGSKRMTQ